MAAINARCGVTQQTIADRDLCRVLVIRQQSTYERVELTHRGDAFQEYGIAHTTAHVNSNWGAETTFLPAVYDDFGIMALVLDTNLVRSQAASLFANLFRSAMVTQQGKNPSHDLSFDLPKMMESRAPGLYAKVSPLKWFETNVVLHDDSFDAELAACWEYLCDNLRRCRVFVRDGSQRPRQLQLFVAHEQAYQALVAHTATLKDWEGNSFEPAAILERAVPEALVTAAGMSENEVGDKKQSMYLYAFVDAMLSAVSRLNVDRLGTDRILDSGLRHLGKALCEGRLDQAAYVAKAAPLLQDRAVILGMESMCIKLAPVTYNEADRSNSVGAAYAKLVSQVSKSVSSQRRALRKADGY